jgi:hypothetical protein
VDERYRERVRENGARMKEKSILGYFNIFGYWDDVSRADVQWHVANGGLGTFFPTSFVWGSCFSLPSASPLLPRLLVKNPSQDKSIQDKSSQCKSSQVNTSHVKTTAVDILRLSKISQVKSSQD